MAEALLARTAAPGLLRPGRSGYGDGEAGVVVRERIIEGAVMLAARFGTAGTLHAAMSDLSLALPQPGHWSEGGGWEAVSLGPDRWLLLGEGDLERRLRERLGTLASLSDQSDSRMILRLSGIRVRDALAKGLPIDLHPRAFGPGRAAVTLAAQIGVVIWQRDATPTFDLAVARSYAGSLVEWLIGATAEYGLETMPPSAG